jgi:hypothetical protein
MAAAGLLNSYLEIGIARGECFNRVAPMVNGQAVAVDINPKCKNYIRQKRGVNFYNMSSDEFFSGSYSKGMYFGLIFIDGNHDYNQLLKDYGKSMMYLAPNGIICIHDTYPPNKEYLLHCKDSYKITDMLKHGDGIEQLTLPFYYGITIVRRKGNEPWK